MARSVTDQTLATSRFSAPGIAVWKSYVGGQKGAEHQLNGIERWSTKPEAAGSNPAGRVPITKRNPAPKAEYRGIDRRGSRTAKDRSDSLEGSSLQRDCSAAEECWVSGHEPPPRRLTFESGPTVR